MDGDGVLKTLAGDLYQGKFRNGFKHGKGQITYGNGGWYQGDWSYNKKEGQGVSLEAGNNSKYEGRFLGNMRHGEGTCTYEDGGRYLGLWQNNLPHKGKLIL